MVIISIKQLILTLILRCMQKRGLEFYYSLEKLIRLTKPKLSVMEIGDGQSQAIKSIFSDYNIEIYNDISGIPRCVSLTNL